MRCMDETIEYANALMKKRENRRTRWSRKWRDFWRRRRMVGCSGVNPTRSSREYWRIWDSLKWSTERLDNSMLIASRSLKMKTNLSITMLFYNAPPKIIKFRLDETLHKVLLLRPDKLVPWKAKRHKVRCSNLETGELETAKDLIRAREKNWSTN